MSANQRPRVRVAPDPDSTLGDLAGGLAAAYGLSPDPWQQIVLDDWLAEKRGQWASLTCGLSVPRQNGKNALIEVRELFGMVGRGERILHTAHEVKTARKHFKRLQHFFGAQSDDPAAKFPELNALVADVRSTNGQESITLRNGGAVEIAARSKSSGRGFTVDVLVMDEAQEMSDDDIEALIPTTSAAPLGNPQWIFAGTPPGPKASGEVFTRVRSESLGKKPRRQCWHEWSAPDGIDLDDRDAWRAVNPGLITGRLQMDVVEGERASFTDEGFGRERLGMWQSSAGRSVIPSQSWALQAAESVAVERFALGLEVGPDQSWAAIALAGQRADGDWHLELVEDQHTRGRGVSWLVPNVEHVIANNPQIRSVVVDVGGPIKPLLVERAGRWFLAGAGGKPGVEVVPLKVADLGAGCSQVLSGVITGSLWHIDQPQLTAAALAAGKRALGDTGMWVWNRRSAESDITPIQAATYALIGAQQAGSRKPMRQKSKFSGKVVAVR